MTLRRAERLARLWVARVLALPLMACYAAAVVVWVAVTAALLLALTPVALCSHALSYLAGPPAGRPGPMQGTEAQP